ncbi:MAG: DUF6036 family nucleotidyltransferase [Steroidobacteraceae bacterium]
MVRSQLQHVILEIGRRFGLRDFYIIGSAAILAVLPNPPEGALTATRDVDIVPPNDDERLVDQISFVLGEASDFDLEHGYYAQGVTSETPAYAPSGWMERAAPVRVEAYTGWCMEAHDLVLSKLGAGREKDIEFAKSAASLALVQRDELLKLLPDVACSDEHRRLIADRIAALFR